MKKRTGETITRRELLSASAGLGLSVSSARSWAADKPAWDLIVVGGGTGGIPTALFAARRARVLIIEKGAILGGTLDRSTGQVAAAGTVFQQAKNIVDSPDEHYDDIMRINGNSSDPELTRLFVDNAASSLNWLAKNGYTVHPEHPVTGQGHEHFRIARYQWGLQGGWSIFKTMEPLVKQAEDSGQLKTLLNTSAVELIQDPSGAITGVVARDSEGNLTDYRAGKVVLASGGCASNASMFEELHGVPLYCQIAHPNSQGAGLTLGLGAGGYLRGGDKYAALAGAILANDSVPAPASAFSFLNPTLRKPWEILVNSNGERFVQEDHPSIDHIEHALAQQPDHRHWAIFDQAILDTAPSIVEEWDATQIMDATNSHPMFSSASSIGELATRTGVNAENLIETVAAFNTARANRRPDPMGLTYRPLPITKPPFYAIRMQGWTLISFAGLGVDTNLQVTKASGEPIPNLHAVGEVIGAGATSGKAYTNGMLVTPAITFGRLLGQRILDFSRA